CDVELELAALFGVGKKSDLLAVRRPRRAAFGVNGIVGSGGDPLGSGVAAGFGNEDCGITGGRAALGYYGFDPGNSFSVRRDGGLLEAAGAEKCVERCVGGTGRRPLCCFEASFNSFC